MPQPLVSASRPLLQRAVFSVIFSSVIFFCAASDANAQADSIQKKTIESLSHVSDKALNTIENKYSLLQKQIESKTEKALQQMQQQESRLQKATAKIDSVKANQLFNNAKA